MRRRFADVGEFGETVRSAHDVGPQLEFGRAEPVALSRRLRLHPVQEAETGALGILQSLPPPRARGDR